MNPILQYKEQIKQLCTANGVRSLFAFGSATRGQLRPDSDIDLVVDFNTTDPLLYADNYFNLKFGLQQLFKRPVDLLEGKALGNKYLKSEIDKTKVLVYG